VVVFPTPPLLFIIAMIGVCVVFEGVFERDFIIVLA